LLTSESAQNIGVVEPKVQATAADVKRKWLLLEEEKIRPRRLVTSQMLINKFQRRHEKEKGENSGHDVMKDVGDVCSSSTVGRKESHCQWRKIVQNATEPTTMETHPRGFASKEKHMTVVTVNSIINRS
jgi:hypothetical protein